MKIAYITSHLFDFKDLDQRDQSNEVFSYHQASGQNTGNIKHELANQKDMFLIFSLVFIFGLIVIKTLYKKHLNHYIASVFNFRYVFEKAHDKNVLNVQFNITMGILSIWVMGIFLFMLSDGLGIQIFEFSALLNLLLFVIVLSLFVVIKWLIHRFMGVIFQISEGLSNYSYVMQYYNKVLGVILIPWILFWPYVALELHSLYMWLGILIMIFFFFLRYVCAFRLIIDHRFSFFYTMLYLCGLEILPLLAGFRYISG